MRRPGARGARTFRPGENGWAAHDGVTLSDPAADVLFDKIDAASSIAEQVPAGASPIHCRAVQSMAKFAPCVCPTARDRRGLLVRRRRTGRFAVPAAPARRSPRPPPGMSSRGRIFVGASRFQAGATRAPSSGAARFSRDGRSPARGRKNRRPLAPVSRSRKTSRTVAALCPRP